jgi:hypothetical protein
MIHPEHLVLKRGICSQKATVRSQYYETWCECWNIKINEDKTQAIYFSHRLRLLGAHLTLNGQTIPFINHVKYLGVIFDNRVTWRLHTEMAEAKTFRTFIRI